MPWVAVAVAVAAAAASAAAKADAKRKAANAMKDAIGNVERINVATENTLAQDYDRKRFEGQLKLQEEVDPTVAAIRKEGAKKLLDTISSPESDTAKALAMKLADENFTEDKGVTAIKDKLINEALDDLARGAQLSPDFQAELVRSGMEAGGRSGLGVSKGTAGERASRQLLGQAGEALKQQRISTAGDVANLATNLQTARTNILTNTAAMLSNLTDAENRRAAGGLTLASEMIPSFGLSGADAVNLDLARINQAQKLTLGLGQVEAQKRIAQGEFNSEMIGVAGQAIGGLAGAGAFGSGIQSGFQSYGGLTGSNLSGTSGWGAGGRSILTDASGRIVGRTNAQPSGDFYNLRGG